MSIDFANGPRMETKSDGIYLTWRALDRQELFEFGRYGVEGAAYRAGQTLMAWVIFSPKFYTARPTE